MSTINSQNIITDQLFEKDKENKAWNINILGPQAINKHRVLWEDIWRKGLI